MYKTVSYSNKSGNNKLLLSLQTKVKHLMKIKVAAVNYLNTKPLLYGIKKSNLFNDIELIEDYPSQVAQKLLDGSVDVGLVPVAIIPQLVESHIITDYCIGCDGAVASVCIFSDVPMEQVETIYLDYQSRTSVELAKILLKEYWKSKAELINASSDDFREKIKGTTAGLVIGDRAFKQRLSSKYIYDLGEAWKAHAGLPFVFAAWVSNKELSPRFIDLFNQGNRIGLEELDEIVKQNVYTLFDLKEYYTKLIRYHLDDEKMKGMHLFLQKVSSNR
jgi:chorismate dehydratase